MNYLFLITVFVVAAALGATGSPRETRARDKEKHGR